MTFGLTNPPSVFQAFISKVFQDMLGWGIVVYVDYILVSSADRAQHVSLVSAVLGRLLEHNLYVKQDYISNYFRSFIRGFSTVLTTLTSLLTGGPQWLCWMAEVERAFETLKARFTTAPVLAHPDPFTPLHRRSR